MPSSRRLPRSRRIREAMPPDQRYSRRDINPYSAPRGSHEPTQWQRELDADFVAMKRVWQMLRHGAVRMLGEVGRQY
jgi:hypothetical protein